jgi:hypothetical protein
MRQTIFNLLTAMALMMSTSTSDPVAGDAVLDGRENSLFRAGKSLIVTKPRTELTIYSFRNAPHPHIKFVETFSTCAMSLC